MEICNVDFFCNVIMVSLLYVHAKKNGWKIRPWPKTVILKIKNDSKMILSLSLSLSESSNI